MKVNDDTIYQNASLVERNQFIEFLVVSILEQMSANDEKNIHNEL